MVANCLTVTFQGVEAREVNVQAKFTSGVSCFTVVGLPDKSINESRERVRAAIHSLGLSLPYRRIIINLSPADLLKEGSHFDLSIALALLVAMEVIPPEAVANYYVMGELSLDAVILPVAGVLPAAIEASARGLGIICPKDNGGEACWAGEDMNIIPVSNLLELINILKGVHSAPIPEKKFSSNNGNGIYPDFKDVRGQASARRAAEVAAAGGHNMLMVGPPGSGKSLIAAASAGIMPDMSAEEILEVSMIYSVAGMLQNGELTGCRPYREPHHSTSVPAMVGGGKNPKPGEISLAHNGVLFMDEITEYPRAVLESLRQPLETGNISIARVNGHVTYPADFQLIAAMNPCKCGYMGEPLRECGKAPRCGVEYQSRLSGPLLDRIDITIEVPYIPTGDLFKESTSEPTSAIKARVERAREIQKNRWTELGRTTGSRINSALSGDDLQKAANLTAQDQEFLQGAADKFRLSMRGYNRILRVARTIADLDAAQTVLRQHLAEALSYRNINFS